MDNINTKKSYIITEAGNLELDDKLYILDILRQQIPMKSIKEHADGCRVNLDRLADDIINKIHHIIISKIKASQSNYLSIET